jgi:protoporphyrinogen oxidase
MVADSAPVVVIGAGPAGLAAAHELVTRGLRPLVLEKSSQVGGISRTEVHDGYRFDIGGHRFFTKVPEVQRLWEGMLGDDFVRVARLSRIYYRRRFFNYPISLWNTLSNLGLWESGMILLSFLRWQALPYKEEENFEQWVTNRFGRRLYRTFFQGYTEKVWGIPCTQIRADWAAQRIQGLSLTQAILNAIVGTESAKSLISEFQYPRLGPGMMWERFAQTIARNGGEVWLNSEVLHLERAGQQVTQVVVRRGTEIQTVAASHVLSSMPLPELIADLSPTPPTEVARASRALRHRSFLMVGLRVARTPLFPDNWVYIQEPEVQAGRIQNFGNWSPLLVPVEGNSSLGIEYFCNEGDALWNADDADLVRLARHELAQIGLADESEVLAGPVIRQPKAYPVYDPEYRANLNLVRGFLAGLENLQTIGRNGMHRYNNMDHSMLTGILAARNVLGEHNDLWAVNTEDTYHEQVPDHAAREHRGLF